MATPAIDHTARENADRHLQSNIASLDSAATSLVETEELPPAGHPPPQRVVTIWLPQETMTSAPVTTFEIDRLTTNTSRVTYSIEGRESRTHLIDQPIVHENPRENRTVGIAGTGERRIVLTLEADAYGEPVVVASRHYRDD